ncbi:glycosyltransferase family 9 protein [Mycobacterium sp. IS-1742]|uniref:glycosyltransferase family 9 protein n=1 Tax=Mycobacterium sp. IS-1742 TaxID=1772285 RepID=UPI001E4C757D|nr:glycosyltransferase family 9 protein [Mycobacterium sp. IS-1742]
MALNHPAGDTILVLRALGLGDLLTGVPALRGLRRAYPHAHIVLATPERFRALAELTGAVDAVEPTPGLGRLRPVRPPPALAVNLHGSGPESIRDLLAVDPHYLLTHRHDAFPGLPGPAWQAELHEVDRWCGLLEWAGIPCDRADLTIPRPPGHPDRTGVVVIHPGAAFPARRWPPERFSAVAAALHAAGHEVVITGDTGELELARAVAAGAGLPAGAVLAGTLGLLGMVALISDCGLLICGDTGVGHIATATGTPSVLLFGPTPPSRWGPPGPGPHVSLWAGREGNPHGGQPDPGLLALTEIDVLEAVDTLLRERV